VAQILALVPEHRNDGLAVIARHSHAGMAGNARLIVSGIEYFGRIRWIEASRPQRCAAL
jgi:hypothetical protein